MNPRVISAAALLCALTGLPSQAAQIDVQLANLSHGNYFTPLLVAGHKNDIALFHTGETASAALQKMAEGGDIADLSAAVTGAGGAVLENPAGGLLAPGMTTELKSLDTGDNGYLSVVGMILPTNDGFVGLDSWKIPTTAGTYTLYLNGYDAGTEANDEIVNGAGAPGMPGIPAAPGGAGGENATGINDTSTNDKVHIHPGVLGDMDSTGGPSDLNSQVHRWLNPIAKLTVTVK
ncbi:spondin domain-containing protein [Shewanella sp. GXUN23E]|uniref:spondin domain-containing protein n=1 Tax=Shewanella sp. GXUN23E TaxID=3422498 RepID=UPI003D7C95EF